MYLAKSRIVFQEHPEFVSLGLWMSGCPNKCPGCHSKELWENTGEVINEQKLIGMLNNYGQFIDNVIYFGGEWEKSELLKFLKLTKEKGLKRTLWTGLEVIDEDIKAEVDFLKTGPYIEALGDLRSPTTNQKYFEVTTGRKVQLK